MAWATSLTFTFDTGFPASHCCYAHAASFSSSFGLHCYAFFHTGISLRCSGKRPMSVHFFHWCQTFSSLFNWTLVLAHAQRQWAWIRLYRVFSVPSQLFLCFAHLWSCVEMCGTFGNKVSRMCSQVWALKCSHFMHHKQHSLAYHKLHITSARKVFRRSVNLFSSSVLPLIKNKIMCSPQSYIACTLQNFSF